MRSRLIALIVAAALIGGGLLVRARTGAAGTTAGPSSSQPVGPPDKSGKGAVEVVCPTEAEALCRDLAARFNDRKLKLGRNRTAAVRLTLADTPDAATRIGNGSLRPVVWMPSSSAWIDRVNQAAHDRTGRDLILRSGQYQALPAALSPLVIAMWADRAAILQKKCPIGIKCLHDAVTSGRWTALGGEQSWGEVKLGHANPLSTNDGLLTLALVAYTYRAGQNVLTAGDIDDARFQDFLLEFEQAVTAFASQSGDFARELVAVGPAQFDAAVTYESTAVAQLDASKGRYPGGLRLFYPEQTISSDHPLAVLVDDSTSAEDKDVGLAFRDFVLSADGQARVVQAGFRPANPATPLPPDSPLAKHAADGVVATLAPAAVADIPNPEVLDALATFWKERVRR